MRYTFLHVTHLYKIFIIFILSNLITGCAFPKQMEYRAGNSPHYQDDDVRFRNIYYMRIFDYCRQQGKDDSWTTKINKDSLFRFEMTGKGHALWNEVYFEAGILNKTEIDPFGTPIRFDKESKRFEFKHQGEIEIEAQQRKLALLDKRYKDLMNMKHDLELKSNAQNGDESKNAKSYIDTQLARLTEQVEKLYPTSSHPGTATSDGGDRCQDGSPSQMEFWILGPEGWRKFNPDERLVLAMSSSGKPLISAMRELSGRYLNEQSLETNQNPVQEEKQRVNQALEELGISKKENSGEIIDDVLKTLKPGGGE